MKDDHVAILAVLVGGAVAFLGYRQWMMLSSGVAMGMGGVLLALRGKRPVQGRGVLRAAVLLAGMAVVGSLMLDLWAEWIAGQWFADGMRDAVRELRRVAQTAVALRSVGVFLSFSFLFGALVNRLRDPSAPAPDEQETQKTDFRK